MRDSRSPSVRPASPQLAAAPGQTTLVRWHRWGYLFVAPWVVGFLIFTAGPMIASIVLSFTNYDLATANFVGARNYVDLVWSRNVEGGHGDPQFYQSLWNTF